MITSSLLCFKVKVGGILTSRVVTVKISEVNKTHRKNLEEEKRSFSHTQAVLVKFK